MDLKVNMGIGDCYYKNKEFTRSLEHYLKALTFSEHFEDIDAQIIAREKMAKTYYQLKNFHSALHHLCLLSTCWKLDEDIRIRVDSQKATCQTLLGHFDDAISTISSLNLLNSRLAKRKFHFNLGFIYLKRGQYLSSWDDLDNAINHFLKAKEFSNDDVMMYKIYKNIGIVYNSKGKFRESLDYFQKAIIFANNDEVMTCNAYHEYANSLINLEEYDKAKELLAYCVEVSTKYNDHYSLGHTYMHYGHMLFKLGLDNEGENNFFEAIRHFLTINSFLEIAECYNYLSKYLSEKQPDVAKAHLRNKELFQAKILES